MPVEANPGGGSSEPLKFQDPNGIPRPGPDTIYNDVLPGTSNAEGASLAQRGEAVPVVKPQTPNASVQIVQPPGFGTMPWDTQGTKLDVRPPQTSSPLMGLTKSRGVIGTIRYEAQLAGVPQAVALAVAKEQSGYQQEAVAADGGVGLFGISQDQARQMGIDPYDWQQNIKAGIRQLADAYQKTGNWRAAVKQTFGGPTPSSLNSSQIQFAKIVSSRTGISLPVMYAWMINEQPGSTDPAGHGYNWLNIGPGRNYASTQAAADATVQLLNSHYYTGILDAARSGNADATAQAIQNSPWDGAHYGYSKIHPTLPQFAGDGSGGVGNVMQTARAIRDGSYKPAGGSTGIVTLSAPLPGNPVVTSGFGPRSNPLGGGGDFHDGVDLAAPQGTPIHAMLGGTVTFSGWTDGSGNTVTIRDKQGRLWNYFHMVQASPVKKGEKIQAGMQIGQVGSTGESTGPHLDIHLMVQGQWVNPMAVIKKAYKVGFGKTGKQNLAMVDFLAPGQGGVNGSGQPVAGGSSIDGGVESGVTAGLANAPQTIDAAIVPGGEASMPANAAAWQRILATGPASPETQNLAARAGAMTQDNAAPALAAVYNNPGGGG